MADRIRMGLQIPSFTYPDTTPDQIFDRVVASAQAAEEVGFDAVLVMDHFYQLPMLGPPDAEMLEAYPLLGALAARTQRVRLGTLVSGNTYRNPAHLAKLVTTLDVLSKGRALCGIGAGWFEPEHVGYGFDFPPLRERFGRLEEALQIARAMFRGERPTFKGRYYRTQEAINSPPPVRSGGPGVLIGGAGEKRTLRLVAKYGDESNWPCRPEEFPRKMEALERHCTEVGRSRDEIGVSWLGSLVVGETTADAEAQRDSFLRMRGMDWSTLPEHVRESISRALVLGDPDTVGEFIKTRILDAGLDGIIVNLPAGGHEPENVRRAGRTLSSVLG